MNKDLLVRAHPIGSNGFYLYSRAARDWVSGVGVKVGSIHDPRGKSGMAHVVEHMLGKFPKDEELRWRMYGLRPDDGSNIRMDRSSTNYGHLMVLRRAFMLDAFDICTRAVLQPERINAQALERERPAVRNEFFLRGKDYIESEFSEWMHQAMYQGVNPASEAMCCREEDLYGITVQEALQFYRANYGAETEFAVLLGLPYPKARRMVEERFGHLKPTGRKPLVIPEVRPKLSGIKDFVIEKRGINQYHVGIGFPTGPYGSPDDLDLDVLADIWQERCWDIIREENRDWNGGSYRVYAETPRTFAQGMIYIWFATPTLESAQRNAERVVAEAMRLRDEFAPDDLYIKAKRELEYDHLDTLKLSVGDLCELIIEAACNGDEEMVGLNSYLERLARVGKKTILRVANEYFTPNAYVHVLVKPDRTDVPNETIVVNGWREVKDVVQSPEPSSA
ncbi:hypothetical protein A2797_01190 [candidate division WWE3 bacterium RIFCSPHIGHO2_01_FULL_48_15]|uniref:Peptidase M16 C-terminal domain-containing protein n=1 Tax=candidate division WWE3 bacterium RIFCSPHIGHO2_01_FULL_48_15 TaxID=1802619 RepID=A0A1F4VES3_UNCKA|nr:MAG: hypothetical protein A2797_01190 [candidate division WWE3 bacterium RIFCSPHIGHO2_01_FULL_48_15]